MKIRIAKLAFAGLLLLTVFSACEKEYPTIQQEDGEEIAKYIQTNSLSGMKEYVNPDGIKSGIFYQITKEGTGSIVGDTSIIFTTFTIKSFDGVANYFEENIYRCFNYLGYIQPKTEVPQGAGLPNAFRLVIKDVIRRKGGTVRFLVPSHKAYGTGGTTSPLYLSNGDTRPGMETAFKIAGNQSLDCTVTLYDANNKVNFEDVFVKKYIAASNITGLTRTNSGLYYKIIEPGTGTEVFSYSTISTVYSGKLINGAVFDENTSAKPFKTKLPDSVVEGWTEGLQLIKKGGKIRLIIPPNLGYGSQASGTIPPNAILDFNIELIDVTN